MKLKFSVDGKGSISIALDDDLDAEQIEALAARSLDLINSVQAARHPIGFSGVGGFETEVADQ